jgi:hypothetical protein
VVQELAARGGDILARTISMCLLYLLYYCVYMSEL